MRKLGVFFIGAALSCVTVFGWQDSVAASAEIQKVYVGGMSAGFTLKTEGVQVIGISDIVTENGTCSPASVEGIQAGDIIRKVAGIKVDSIADLNDIVDKSKGKTMSMELLRGGETISLSINAVKEKRTEKYKIGILARENVSGIGTITYIDKQTGRFGALGHSVVGENNKEMQISNGMVYECSIVGICKGVRGKAGELRGMFLNDKFFGHAEKLNTCGIFGKISDEFSVNTALEAEANSSAAKPGNAYIYSTVSGVSPKRYSIEIVKVDKYNHDNKNYVIKITDEDLIAETGGIVQGMSGSPIIQNGKLIGAVTHVLISDPTRGYGIFIENMLEH